MKKKPVFALYAKSHGFSGQCFAIETVIEGLLEKDWLVSSLKMPSIDRSRSIGKGRKLSIFVNILNIIFPTLIMWLKVLFLNRNSILYLGMGQTKFSLIREGIPVALAATINPFHGLIISLHGSDFMNWSEECFEKKLFLLIAKKANFITVLGPNQLEKMISFGVKSTQLIIVDNTCLVEEISYDNVRVKHSDRCDSLKILFLSSLIESKGYIQFVNSIMNLVENSTLPLSFTLCGKILFKQDEVQQFESIEAVQNWLTQKMNEINASVSVRLKWIQGAVGLEKQKLFHESHIFVLPSQYKTEAQPIVIIEALASGCAVITTNVGEIPTTISSNTAVLLEQCTAEGISDAIEQLITDAQKRRLLATNGLKLFTERFSYTKHMDKWETIFQSLLVEK
jgi:glycosyltransferase involved in cell wall biosynthesis